MPKLKAGIAGFGVVGQRRKACLDAHPDMEVVAVCDRTFTDVGPTAEGVRRYRNYEELLQDKLDVLFVCLTNDVAPAATIAGLEAGAHVFCEKPPGRNVEDIVRVMRVERAHPLQRLMYGFNHRYQLGEGCVASSRVRRAR